MTIFWRDLLLGLLAWGSGRMAERYVSSIAYLEMNRLSDWLTFVMFRPGACLAVIVFFLFAFWLVWRIAAAHARHALIRHSVVPGPGRMLHVVLLVYALFLLFVLGAKFPVPVLGCLLLAAARAVSRWRGHRLLRSKVLRADGRSQ
ncbi:MAG: hypothetical protein H0Z34_04875 [Brevibacillus sp.]|nr:hypothetical protein [Brevibacillus sp.]